jgi:tetratricopeptide (TPR) repeat protein
MTKSQTKGVRLGLAMLGAGMLLSTAPLAAQTGNPAMDGPREALSRNLRSLAENPKSVQALMGAGRAALELGDPQASITFFGRAEEQAPRDGRIKMWIGAALLQLQQAQGGLKFFSEASSLGVPEPELAGHRGLAWDLLGDNRRAQRDYRLALASKPDAEVMRRLALSLAISGEREPALRTIEDQLLVRDRAAERTRAFVLALTGDAAGAARAVQTSMPGAQSSALSPFLERLPALTPTERAMAVHFGHFPKHGRNLPVPPANSYAALNTATAAGTPDRTQNALGKRAPAARSQRGTQVAAAQPQRQTQVAASQAPGETRNRGSQPQRQTQVAAAQPSGETQTAGAQPQRSNQGAAAQPQRGTQIAAAQAPLPRWQPRVDRPAASAPRQPAAAAERPRSEPSRPVRESAWDWSRGASRVAETSPRVERQQQQVAAVAPAPRDPGLPRIVSGPAQPAATPAQQAPATAMPAQQMPVRVADAAPAASAPFRMADAAANVGTAPVSAPASAFSPPVIANPGPAFAAPAAGMQTQAAPLRIADAAPAAADILNAPGFSLGAPEAPQSAVREVALAASSVAVTPLPAPAPVEERGASRLASVGALIATLEEPAPAPPAAPAASAPTPATQKAVPAPAAAAKVTPPAKVPVVAAARKEPAAAAAGTAAKKDAAPAAAASAKGIDAAKPPAAKPAAKKNAAADKEPVKPAEPSRHWVQVAGGADKAALPREFARLKAKAPKLLSAQTAWTTPLRATNRLLVGPFKSDDDAQSFVNELGKAELTAFAWTSEAGQKIEKLSAK